MPHVNAREKNSHALYSKACREAPTMSRISPVYKKLSLALYTLCLTALLLSLAVPTPASALEAGRVITITPGVVVQRGAQTLPLKAQDTVEQGDTLTTDATGRVRILFSDDGSIALGPNTVFTLESYVADGAKPSFSGRMAKGLLRSITGKIVEQNPSGFALSTPEVTIGIRGSIVSARSENGSTSVYVENTLRQVYVNGTNVPQLHKITIAPSQPPRVEPITPQDRRDIGRDLAFLGGNGSAAAAPEPGTGTGTASANELTAKMNDLPETPALADLPVADLATPPLLPTTSTTASISGTLTTTKLTGATAWSGSFGFDVNLGSGTISGATMSLSGTLGQDGDGGGLGPIDSGISLAGGSGSVSGNSFSINGFTGSGLTAHPTYPGVESV
jgi:hypothetical protein